MSPVVYRALNLLRANTPLLGWNAKSPQDLLKTFFFFRFYLTSDWSVETIKRIAIHSLTGKRAHDPYKIKLNLEYRSFWACYSKSSLVSRRSLGSSSNLDCVTNPQCVGGYSIHSLIKTLLYLESRNEAKLIAMKSKLANRTFHNSCLS